jgi:hypothetical protein
MKKETKRKKNQRKKNQKVKKRRIMKMPVDITENYIRIRQKDPKGYTRMRTISIDKAKGIKAIIGVRKDGKSEVQSFLFVKAKWTVKRAQAWISKHKKLSELAESFNNLNIALIKYMESKTTI